jgi:hypothetical protein
LTFSKLVFIFISFWAGLNVFSEIFGWLTTRNFRVGFFRNFRVGFVRNFRLGLSEIFGLDLSEIFGSNFEPKIFGKIYPKFSNDFSHPKFSAQAIPIQTIPRSQFSLSFSTTSFHEFFGRIRFLVDLTQLVVCTDFDTARH